MSTPLDLSDLALLREQTVSIAYRETVEGMSQTELRLLLRSLETALLVAQGENTRRAWRQDLHLNRPGLGVAA